MQAKDLTAALREGGSHTLAAARDRISAGRSLMGARSLVGKEPVVSPKSCRCVQLHYRRAESLMRLSRRVGVRPPYRI
jgi:hypothetical protein